MQENRFTSNTTSQHIQHAFNGGERRQPSFKKLNFDLNVCNAEDLDPIRTRQPLNVIQCKLMRVGSLEGKARGAPLL
jgi:hypothetical protein